MISDIASAVAILANGARITAIDPEGRTFADDVGAAGAGMGAGAAALL